MQQPEECNNESITHNVIQDLKLSVPILSRDDFDITTNVLGKGTFGTVNKGLLHRTAVAVKSIRLSFNNKYIEK